MISEGKIIHEESKFHVHDRIKSWEKQSQFIFDDDLDKLKIAMLKVFGEEDPKYTLAKDKRIFAELEGKKLKYSADLRKGLAITLALIGNYNNLLIHCSKTKRELFTQEVIQEVFKAISWQQIATLNYVFPFFAEADPDTFLKELKKLADTKSIIYELINDEGDIFYSGFHWTGIIHALEILAWEPEYFAQVVLLLADFALLDIDSNIHPRPQDALRQIFCPWFHQTTVGADKLIAFAKILSERYPDLAWNVLSSVLDMSFGSFHQRPEIRKNIAPPIDSKQTIKLDIVIKIADAYRNIMLEMAAKNIDFSIKLLRDFSKFKEFPFLAKVLEIFSSPLIQTSNDAVKEEIWSGLNKICILHKRHQDAEWAFSAERIVKIQEVSSLLKPESILYQKKYLFDVSGIDWYETDDYTTEEARLSKKRTDAVKEILKGLGINGIWDFAELVHSPELLGLAVKQAESSIDNSTIKRLISGQNKNLFAVVAGYLKQCFEEEKDALLNNLRKEQWCDQEKAALLSCLPFCSKIWHFAEKWLTDEKIYWQKVKVRFVGDNPDCLFAIGKSLQYNRPDIAQECIAWEIYRKKTIPFNVCIETLKNLAESNKVAAVDGWHITQIIIDLQNRVCTASENKNLALIEFLYLPLLDKSANNDISPVTLNKTLATDPNFFQEIVSMLYKSDKQDAEQNYNQSFAHNAYRLLNQWDCVPGKISDEVFDYSVFLTWYEQVIGLCKQSGHLKVAQLHIGNVLFYTTADKEGLWIDKNVASLLDAEQNTILREGYVQTAIKSRGFSIVDFSGEKDYKLANAYNEKASALEDYGFFNFAKTLRNLAKDSENDALRSIEDGRKRYQKEEL